VVTCLYNNRGSGVFCGVRSVPRLYKRDSLKGERTKKMGTQRITTEYNREHSQSWNERENENMNGPSLKQSPIMSCCKRLQLRVIVTEVPINPIIQSRPSLLVTKPRTRDNINKH
jgi:hypothetical protein